MFLPVILTIPESRASTPNLWLSANRMYMRSKSSAQILASSPPAPARISRVARLGLMSEPVSGKSE